MDPSGAEASRSKTPHLLASGSSSTSTANRKARSSEPETTGRGNVERSSVSMPPPASKAVPKQFPSRRPSKASDYSLREAMNSAHYGSTIDDAENAMPALESARGNIPGASLTLPDLSRPPHSETDAESHRMSFSSLYSISSGIHPGAKRMSWAASATGSDEGKSLPIHRSI